MFAQLKKIGIEPGKSFDIDKAEPAVRSDLANAPKDGQHLIEWFLPRAVPVVNGWLTNITATGVYGNWYLKRAAVAKEGLGANPPEDAIYPSSLGDEAGKPLDGANKYTFNSTRAKRRRQARSGRPPSTTRKASRFRIRSIDLISAAGCHSNTAPMGRSNCTSRTKIGAQTRKRTGS